METQDSKLPALISLYPQATWEGTKLTRQPALSLQVSKRKAKGRKATECQGRPVSTSSSETAHRAQGNKTPCRPVESSLIPICLHFHVINIDRAPVTGQEPF